MIDPIKDKTLKAIEVQDFTKQKEAILITIFRQSSLSFGSSSF